MLAPWQWTIAQNLSNVAGSISAKCQPLSPNGVCPALTQCKASFISIKNVPNIDNEKLINSAQISNAIALNFIS